jgi:hypothetical protein
MKYLIAIVPVLFVATNCVAQDQGKLTPSIAKTLLPKAASVRIDDLDKLVKGEKPKKENQSPTYWLLTFKPDGEPLPKDSEKDLDLFSRKLVNANKLLEAMNASKAEEFASVIQSHRRTSEPPDESPSSATSTLGPSTSWQSSEWESGQSRSLNGRISE